MRFQNLILSVLAYVLSACISMSVQATSSPVILILGDSLSAGYGMAREESWPRLLEQRLAGNGQRYRVVNSSISGDTTQGGLARLPELLERHEPAYVIIELGGNDGLRGLPLAVTRANLRKMAAMSRDAGAAVLLVGIKLPPNYGPAYTDGFSAIFRELAEEENLLLVPFFMEGVALVEGMMQADGIHPNAAAQPVLLDNVWKVLAPELAR